MKKEITLKNIKKFTIAEIADNIKIDFYQNEENKIEISYTDDFDKNYKILINENDSEVKIESFEKIKFDIFNFKTLFRKNNELSLKIPQNIFLEIRSLGGNININKDKLKVNLNKLFINSKTGDIIMNNIKSSETIIKNLAGDVIIDSLISLNIEFKNMAGNTKLENICFSKLYVTSNAGDVKINVLNNDFKYINVNCNAGDVRINVPVYNLNYKLKSLAGDVSLNGINFDLNSPELEVKSLAGDINVSYSEGEKSYNENDLYLNSFFEDKSINRVKEKDKDKEKEKEKDKDKILSMLLENKINENEAKEILLSLNFSKEEIDLIFEEYLFLKMKMEEKTKN